MLNHFSEARDPIYVGLAMCPECLDERLARQVLLAKPTGKQPRGHPRTR